MGEDAYIDTHIVVDSRISVSEGHQIGEVVRTSLINEVKEVTEVLVHIDPENDKNSQPNLSLPLRHEITVRLQKCWQSLGMPDAIKQISLHYLTGKLTVDVYLPLRVAQNKKSTRALSRCFSKFATNEPYVHTINIYYC
jgi:hypothetical protein